MDTKLATRKRGDVARQETSWMNYIYVSRRIFRVFNSIYQYYRLVTPATRTLANFFNLLTSNVTDFKIRRKSKPKGEDV